MRNSILRTLAFGISSMIITHASVALAEDTPNAIHIPLAGLDLASPAGRKALDTRIKIAAEDLCDESTAATLLRPTKCINEAIESVHARRDWLIADYRAAQLDTARTISAPILMAQGASATSAH